uniref:carbonic anhydrase n=1 Tax=Neobodo designis TaxID=312471 RepID=A0A7S1LE46_NEODS|mmetsp:Transcript_20336/g.63193  ORF Transcript_20336/g.63193 Transcript_20336/m.63193 type:complete len:336 (+) Transcript_20336:34-1041(+)
MPPYAGVVLLLTAAATLGRAALDWSYCHGMAPSAVANGSVVCPAGWHTRYPHCGGEVQQAPLNLAHGSVVVDTQLRPFDLNWVASQEMVFEAVHGVSLTATPRDVKPALWDPNEGAAYALQRVEFASPSLHAVGGGRRDLEVMFVHTRRGDDPATAAQLVVSLLFEASPVRPDHEALRALAYPVVVDGATSLNASQSHPQRADFAAAAPLSRDYVTYDAAGAAPPCRRPTRYVVMQEVVGASLEQVARIRAAMGLGARTVDGVERADGNVRPTQSPRGSAPPARRFVDYVGEHLFAAEPEAPTVNKLVDDIAIAALALSCTGVVTALLAARLSQA